MPVARLLAAAAKRHAMQQRAMIADDGRLADDDARCMVEHQAFADPRGRMDIDREDARALALEIESEILPPFDPQRMGKAVRDERMEALEVEQRLDIAMARRVAIVDGREVRAEAVPDLGAGAQDILERMANEARVDVRMIETLRKAMADGVLETLVAQYGRIVETSERALGSHNSLRLRADGLPDGIVSLDPAARCGVRCDGHDRSSPWACRVKNLGPRS